jgi:hypothetical protein
MRWLGLCIGVIVAGLFEEWVYPTAQNHPGRVAILLGIGLLLAGLVWFVTPDGSRAWVWVTFALAAGGFALVRGLDARDHELGTYCKYGAKTKAQLDHCMPHVTTEDIDELDTPGARFARGETRECGRGSGPYCAEAADDF